MVNIMVVETLVSTMHQKNLDIVNKMNIQTKAIIINQCDSYGYIEDDIRSVQMYSFNEKGIGKSRNNALMRATGDICVLADDDEVFVDNYETIIKQAFLNNPKADLILFNVPSTNKERPTVNIIKNKKVNSFNFMKYGAVNIAFKRESILKANVYFSLLFGGGAKYSAGEDTLFIHTCLEKGLNIFSDTAKIASVKQESSSWFSGYNEKYFFDKGVFFASLSKKMAYALILQYAIRKHSLYKKDVSFKYALRYMIRGVKY